MAWSPLVFPRLRAWLVPCLPDFLPSPGSLSFCLFSNLLSLIHGVSTPCLTDYMCWVRSVQVLSVNEAVPGGAGLLSSTHHNVVLPPGFLLESPSSTHEIHFTPLVPKLKVLHNVALNILSRPLAHHNMGLSALHTLPFPASHSMPSKASSEKPSFIHLAHVLSRQKHLTSEWHTVASALLICLIIIAFLSFFFFFFYTPLL